MKDRILTIGELRAFLNTVPAEFDDQPAGVDVDESFTPIRSVGFVNQNFYAEGGDPDTLTDEYGYNNLPEDEREGYVIVIKKGEPFMSIDAPDEPEASAMNDTPDDGESSAPGEDEGGEGGTDPRHVHPSQPPVGGN